MIYIHKKTQNWLLLKNEERSQLSLQQTEFICRSISKNCHGICSSTTKRIAEEPKGNEKLSSNQIMQKDEL